MENNKKQFKTPSYILKAVHTYNKKNSEIINQKARERYAKLTDEQKKNRMPRKTKLVKETTYSIIPDDRKEKYKQKKREQYNSMTPEAKEAYNAKQRAYYQARKQKQKQNIQTENTN